MKNYFKALVKLVCFCLAVQLSLDNLKVYADDSEVLIYKDFKAKTYKDKKYKITGIRLIDEDTSYKLIISYSIELDKLKQNQEDDDITALLNVSTKETTLEAVNIYEAYTLEDGLTAEINKRVEYEVNKAVKEIKVNFLDKEEQILSVDNLLLLPPTDTIYMAKDNSDLRYIFINYDKIVLVYQSPYEGETTQEYNTYRLIMDDTDDYNTHATTIKKLDSIDFYNKAGDLLIKTSEDEILFEEIDDWNSFILKNTTYVIENTQNKGIKR